MRSCEFITLIEKCSKLISLQNKYRRQAEKNSRNPRWVSSVTRNTLSRLESEYKRHLGWETQNKKEPCRSTDGCFLEGYHSQKPIELYYITWLDIRTIRRDFRLNFDKINSTQLDNLEKYFLTRIEKWKNYG